MNYNIKNLLKLSEELNKQILSKEADETDSMLTKVKNETNKYSDIKLKLDNLSKKIDKLNELNK